MADKSKSEKLAAAKRKLKEFKSKQKFEGSVTPIVNDDIKPPDPINDGQEVEDVQYADPSIDIPVQPEPSPPNINNSNESYNNDLSAISNAVVQVADDPNIKQLPVESKPQLIDFASEVQPSVSTELALEATQPIAATGPIGSNQISDLSNANERNQELCTQLWMQHAAMEQMRLEIDRLRQELQNSSVSTDIDMLNKQLQSHVHSIEVLVSEKTELTNQLGKHQSEIASKTGEIEELQARLFASRYRGQVLEKELDTLKSAHEKYDGTQQTLCTELENARDENKRQQKSIEDQQDQIAELKQKLNLKVKDFEDRGAELEKVKFDLNLSQLRVEQFSAGDQIESSNKIETLITEKNKFEQQAQELQQTVQQLNTERDVMNQQYQNYVQHLNRETTTLTGQVQTLAADNERLAKRETELTKHIGDLERQIQQQIAKRKSLSEVQKSAGAKENVDDLIGKMNLKCEQLEADKNVAERNVQELQQQLSAIGEQLQTKVDLILELESTCEQLRSEQPNSRNLFATIESDKVAASRAVAQNQELKLQLEEIQNAYIQLSNDKLELTDRLQSEQHLGREIQIKSSEMETDLKEIKDKLFYKDQEMMRLSHENEELNKNLLQQSQELDRLRHYEAKVYSMEQLHINANEQINKLRLRVKEFERNATTGLIAESGEHELAENKNDMQSIETDRQTFELPVDELDHQRVDNATLQSTSEIEGPKFDTAAQHHAASENSETMSISSTLNIATDQAMDRLQQRFTRTMSEVADLTEEKYRLEHLVMQLQGETETIGEYIALYQNQRRLLKQREVEKDIQLQQIAIERETMKSNLVRLNNLVVQLLMQNGVENAKELVQSVQQQQQKSSEQENGESITNGNVSENEIIDTILLKKDVSAGNTDSVSNTETATEILKLLSEIKEKNLNPDFAGSHASNVQHCHCCSGKLETV